jgi:hypothetical protein
MTELAVAGETPALLRLRRFAPAGRRDACPYMDCGES